MGCIAKILELKGDRDFILAPNNPGIIVEDGGTYKGFEYLTVLNGTGFRCGYVAIDTEHPLYKHNKEGTGDDYPDLDVHGGVTFFEKQHLIESDCDDKWIGFDCGHAGDGWDYDLAISRFESVGNSDAAEGLREVKKIRKETNEKMEYEHPGFKSTLMGFETVKTKDYVINECRKLIDQLVA